MLTRGRTGRAPAVLLAVTAALLLAGCGQPEMTAPTPTDIERTTMSAEPTSQEANEPTAVGGCDDRAYDMAARLAPDDLGAPPELLSAERFTVADVRVWQSTPVEGDPDDGIPDPRPAPQPWVRDLDDDLIVDVCTYRAEVFAAPNRAGGEPYTHLSVLVPDGGEPQLYRAWGDADPGPTAPEGAEPLWP